MSYNIYCVAVNSDSTLPRKKNPKCSMHECWKGDKRKPRKVMTTKLPSGRSSGVSAHYAKLEKDKNGRWVVIDE